MTQVKIFIGLPDIANSARQFGMSRRMMQRPTIVEAIEEAGRILLKWQRLRFIALSRSPGRQWRDIKQSTKDRKARKKRRGQIKARAHWIMRENDGILSAIDVERSRRGRRGFNVGILKDRPHSGARISTGTLASLHNPIWPIVAKPPRNIMERVQRHILQAMEREQEREARRTPPTAPPVARLQNFRRGGRR